LTTEPWSLTSHAMMNVALVDVAVANRAGAVKDVAVASAVDRHLGADRELALLALEDFCLGAWPSPSDAGPMPLNDLHPRYKRRFP